MPRLWNETIEAHRLDVRDAILDATAALMAEDGPLGVTMSRVAERAGIGRATLYKYFPDVEAVLVAWHERHVEAHLERLAAIRDRPGSPAGRLEAVLETYALIVHESARHHDPAVAAFLHRGPHAGRAASRLRELVGELVAAAAAAGEIRGDVAAGELAAYCLHALAAAAGLPSRAAVRRLVAVTTSGLRPGS